MSFQIYFERIGALIPLRGSAIQHVRGGDPFDAAAFSSFRDPTHYGGVKLPSSESLGLLALCLAY
ncbi:MAG: hypothetical protein AAB288_14425 [Acidobacteriota bacterium]